MNKDNLIEFANEQSVVFPEDSAMGWYLRETLKMLQAEQCEDAVSKKDMYFNLTNGAYPNETIKQFIDRLVKELESMPPVTPIQKWIPVSERLPDIHNYSAKYLTTVKGVGVHILSFTECDGEHWWEYKDVIAWMPLPEPYTEKLD